jgi:hypothetical protein
VFETRRLFGPKRDEVTGVWRKLRNEELHNLYSSPNIIRMIKSRSMKWAGHVVRKGEQRDVYRALVGKPDEKRPLQRHIPMREDNIKINRTEIGRGYGLDSSGLEYKLIVGSREHDNKTFWLHKISGNY